jgi:hypothetical protein
MPKKRVGVTLRKPSQAPEGVPESSEAPSAEVSMTEPLRAPLERSTVEAFVNGAAAALEKAASEIPLGKLRELIQRGPDGYRELRVYLPEKLAQDLSLHCLEHNLDMNRLVATAVEQHLSGSVGARDLHGAVANDQASTTARALLAELAGWVRSIWSKRLPGWALRDSPLI